MKGKKIMKKMFLTLVAVMSMTMAFAEDENTVATNTVAAYDMITASLQRHLVCQWISLRA